MFDIKTYIFLSNILLLIQCNSNFDSCFKDESCNENDNKYSKGNELLFFVI